MFPWDGTEVRELIAIYMVSKLMETSLASIGMMNSWWSRVVAQRLTEQGKKSSVP